MMLSEAPDRYRHKEREKETHGHTKKKEAILPIKYRT